MKKIISLLTAFVMSGTLFLSALPAGAEENPSAGQPAIENDMKVESTNSFGDLIADKITAKTAEQQANNGCNIFSAEVTGNKAVITFETLRECTLIAAIYDESGTQLLASGSEIVEKGEKEKTVTIDIKTMPQYFYFKAFLVDMVTLKPISTVYESPNYTQEMQEFFAKTVDDFDSEMVLNLDDDKSTNFAVFGEDTKIITTDGTSNKVAKADKDNQQYVFENADETMTALKVGDIFAYQYENKEMLIVKVGKIDVSGTTVTVTGEDTSLEKVFEYVKIETDSDMSDAKVDGSNLPEGITYADNTEETDKPKAAYADMGYMPEKYSLNEISAVGFVDKSIKAVIDNYYIGDKDSDNYVKVSGSAELGMNLDFKLYLSWTYQHLELKDDYSVKVALAIEGQVEGSIPLGYVPFTPVPGILIAFTPSVVVRLNAKLEISGTLTGTIGFNIDNYTGFTSLCTTPEFDTEIKVEGTFFIGLGFKPELDLGGKYVASTSFTIEVGIQVKATYAPELTHSETKRHSCKVCLAIELAAKINFSAEVTFLNCKDLTWGYEADGAEFKIGDFYWSLDKMKFGIGTCPYYEYLVNVVVKDINYKPVSGALISKTTDPDNYVEADENGMASCFIPGGETYPLMARKANLRGYKNLNVYNEGTNIYVYLDSALPVDPIDVSFSVVDKDGNPVEGAEISNDFTDDTCTSDAEGKATMKLHEGYYIFSVNAPDFAPFSDAITVTEDNCDIKIKVLKYGDFPNLGIL